MLEEHGSSRSTRSSRLARLARQSRTCRVESSRAKWNLGFYKSFPTFRLTCACALRCQCDLCVNNFIICSINAAWLHTIFNEPRVSQINNKPRQISKCFSWFSFVGVGPISSSMRAVVALQWWNVVRMHATIHPWLLRNSASVRRAAMNPYPVLHQRLQYGVDETDDVTQVGGATSGETTPTAEPEQRAKCDSDWKPGSPSPSAHARKT